MFWILVIGIVIVYCVLKGEDNSGSSSNKRYRYTSGRTESTIKLRRIFWQRKSYMMKEIICLYYIVVLVLKTEIILKCIGRMRCSMMLMEEWLMCSIKGAEELCQSMMSSVNIRRQ